MRITVIDGQGGRVGSQVIEAMRKAGIGKPQQIIAVGTNSIATASMLKAGADQGATGENPVVVAARSADIIIGPIGILMADALLGEITEAMSAAVGRSSAMKLLMPVSRCSAVVIGTQDLQIPQIVNETVTQVLKLLSTEPIKC